MTIAIAGERSGAGKTTVTLAMLASLCRREGSVQSFKVGPDYIDPMFHRYVTGRPCYNLDPLISSETYVRQCFDRYAARSDCAIVEGVMGLFDGVRYGEAAFDFASTAHVARLLDAPVALVLDCTRLSGSAAAIAHGYRTLDPRVKLAGVILNRVGSDRHLELIRNALEPLQIPILGVLRRHAEITIPDRHLGLIPTDEMADLDRLIDRLADLGDRSFDWSQLLPLLRTERRHDSEPSAFPSPSVRIAIARDRAFSFYYPDNLDLLRQFGAKLVPWSPLSDRNLPENVSGLYFGGGFPEVFAAQLADNRGAMAAVKQAIRAGMPAYAECGGLMYLCQQMVDLEERSHPMVGILPTTTVMDKRLTLGYRHAEVLRDSPLLAAGTTVWGHEFHRSRLDLEPPDPLFRLRSLSPQYSPTGEGWQFQQLHASYLHLHWGATPEIPQRFVARCGAFQGARSLGSR